MAQRIATCASWGFPLDNNDVRYLVKGYLDKRGLTLSRFTNNTPSKDWVNSFVKRNENIIFHRICQNITPSRAGVGNYFTRWARFGKTVEIAGRTLIGKQGKDLFFWRSRSTYECDH